MLENPQIILATRLQRIIATLIDLAIACVIILPFIKFARINAQTTNGPLSIIPLIYPALATLTALLGLVLLNTILLFKRSQTIGKAIMHIKIVRAHFYTPASTLSILATYLLLFIILFIPYYIGPLILLINALFIFTPKKRYLHDLFTYTNVVRVATAQKHITASTSAS